MLSRRLSRISRFGDNLRRCERCAILDFGTCQSCRRYRKLILSDEKALCHRCQFGADTTCALCGSNVPAGRGDHCEHCYWSALLLRRIKINSALLKTEKMQVTFVKFAHWFGESSGDQKAALSLARYAGFFEQMDFRWQGIPSYIELLDFFGVDKLRRYRKAVQWLEESGQIELDAGHRQRVAEEHRITRMFEVFRGATRASSVLNEYMNELRQRLIDGDIQFSTIRLYLIPAFGLMQKIDHLSGDLPMQDAVGRYLADSPGQRASLGGFLAFLNRRYKTELRLPDKHRTFSRRRSKIEARLAALAKIAWAENVETEWIVHALEYFHGESRITPAIVRSLARTSVNSGLELTIKGQHYYIPIPPAWCSEMLAREQCNTAST